MKTELANYLNAESAKLKQSQKPLTPYEKWMVKSNLKTIQDGTPADQLVKQLQANGYPRIAEAVTSRIEKAGAK